MTEGTPAATRQVSAGSTPAPVCITGLIIIEYKKNSLTGPTDIASP